MSAALPQPLHTVPASTWRRVVGVMTDIDDTLTTDGRLDPAAGLALEALHAAHVPVIAITGRSMGWSEPFALEWPVAAIVAENGALALRRDGDQLQVEYVQDAATRARQALRLQAVAQRILRELPGATLARDSAGRVTDIAVDHAEFARLDAPAIAQVLAIMRAEGLNATVSSIHINGWFGTHDKPSGARWMVQRLYGRALDDETERWVYVGDSANDQGMFAYLPLSVGVANLMRWAAEMHCWPTCITQDERGAGFAEVASALLHARRAP